MPVAPPNLTDARRHWLAELYEANSVAVFNLCRRLLNSREDAADATHEVFLRAASSLDEAPGSQQARAWLMTVARNYCIDLLRRRERYGSAMITLAATTDATADAVTTVEDRELLLKVLQQMGVRERAALWESAVESRPLAEIARRSGMSYMAAAKLVSRARHTALVLATRLAVILGLFSLGRAARRVKLAGKTQQLAAVVAMPLAIAVLVISSAPHPPVTAQAAKTAVKGSTAQILPSPAPQPSPLVVAPAPSPAPSPAPAPVVASVPTSAVLAATVVVVHPAPTPVVVPPVPTPAPVTDVDKDHGKGRDNDDLPRTGPGNGLALGHHK